MPFIPQDEREGLKNGSQLPSNVGQLCFLEYSKMMEEWNKNPRWTTAHNIYKSVSLDWEVTDKNTARQLAWQVFFNLHVMEYERLKRQTNGDIL